MKLDAYARPGELTWEAGAIGDEIQTYIKVTRLHKNASHILFFKSNGDSPGVSGLHGTLGTPGTFGTPGALGTLGTPGAPGLHGTLGAPESFSSETPALICEKYDLLRNQEGVVAFGRPAAIYYGVTARYADGAYYIDSLNIKEFSVGDHISVQYAVKKTNYSRECDKVVVTFNAASIGNHGAAAFGELYYSIEGINAKYPIHPKMLRDNAFTVYIPANRDIRVYGNEGSHVRAFQA